MNIKRLSILFLLFTSFLLNAQNKTLEIKGKVIEENSQLPIAYATILIADKDTKIPITGTTSNDSGDFVLSTEANNFYIEISFIGFNTITISDYKEENQIIDLKTVTLSENLEALSEVVVQAERSQTEFKLDKRVFNVGKDLSSTGASALEVLNNVPSVTVNIEGVISLRGSQGVQMLINGKPSVLASEEGNALGTITADMIEKIEVITNPSAKYDAEGTSGIINIILKKEEKRGLNGSVTLNTGTPNNHSLGLSLNKRTEKFNLFSQIGIGRRTFPSEYKNINSDFINNTTINSNGESDKNETFYNIVLGTDYHINDNNVLTLSGNFAYEQEDENSTTSFSSINELNTITDSWKRVESTEATNPKWEYELQYKKDFKKEDQSLLFSALGNFFGKDQESIFNNTTITGANDDGLQSTKTDFKQAEYTFKLDYTHPFLEKYKIETGAQYVLNDVENDYEVNDFIGDEWVNNPDLTNLFEFKQNVLGVYTTGAYESDKWGIKLGVRLENTDLNTLLTNTNEKNNKNYTDLFPSAHTSYKVTDNFSIQAGYSKRIYRPRLWDLNPFFNIRNNFSIYTGNPNLQPEYTDSYEITSIHKIGKASLNLSLYNRYTTDVIERVTTFEDNVSTTRPENFGTNSTTGFEINGKYSPLKWFSLNGDFNINYFNRKGDFEGTSFDFNGNSWTSRLTTKFKLPADIDMELSGNYRSKYRTLLSDVSDTFFADFGMRKKIFKGKAILNLSVRDVFASRRNESVQAQPDYYIYSHRQRGRFVTFGVSFGFGKGEAMEFSGQKRF
ncbi:TonB-dependent receptor domain-containing protein [Pontimicrobium sp. IMCC45349]|uniref:TonB-dependent receptor domain-containing protein n=1 Tax=Pontimicrobium sp. IMCC45349 TaxID=3391574 RepID=UPI00399FC1EB